jgi:uncharacterized protein YqjF (DUF2071 family)
MSSSGFLAAAARQAQAIDDVSGRPWPLPEEPWAQAQTREDVLFAHWPVALDELARQLPPEVPVDTFDGEAWLGIVPFRLASLRLRGLPPVPGLSPFPQLDVRTYVTLDGRPGIWLFSLDTTSQLLAEAAKRVHRLPAYRARITAHSEEAGMRYEALRDGLAFRASYRGAGEPFAAAPGTLDHFLTERYCLYTADGGRLYRAELHHAPWRLESGTAEIEETTISPLSLDGPPHLLFSRSQDVLIWTLEEL